jgi:hypothetical protein
MEGSEKGVLFAGKQGAGAVWDRGEPVADVLGVFDG